MPYGYKFVIGVQRVTQPDPDKPRGRVALVAAILALGAVAIAMLIVTRAPSADPVPAAQVAPATSAAIPGYLTPTPTPTPTQSYRVVRVPVYGGAVCLLPGGKTINPVTLAEVP